MSAVLNSAAPAPPYLLDEDEADDPRLAIVRRWLPVGSEERRPATRAIVSVFGLDSAPPALVLWQSTKPSPPEPYRVERSLADGRVRVIRLRPEETTEWQERELARRARQRPPKPTFKAKTRGRKVRAWDGEGGLDS
jgi:hypothetical protein